MKHIALMVATYLRLILIVLLLVAVYWEVDIHINDVTYTIELGAKHD